jgi:hypothetical protein
MARRATNAIDVCNGGARAIFRYVAIHLSIRRAPDTSWIADHTLLTAGAHVSVSRRMRIRSPWRLGRKAKRKRAPRHHPHHQTPPRCGGILFMKCGCCGGAPSPSPGAPEENSGRAPVGAARRGPSESSSSFRPGGHAPPHPGEMRSRRPAVRPAPP